MKSELSLHVARSGDKARVAASRSFEPGTVLMLLEGRVAPAPDRYSIQVGVNKHLMPRDAACIWQFLNHSCAPNAAVVGRKLVAIREIAAGDEVTFNYNANEYAMDAPFHCWCGHCGGVQVRGYRYLSEDEREQIAPWVAAHVRQQHAQAEATPAALAVNA